MLMFDAAISLYTLRYHISIRYALICLIRYDAALLPFAATIFYAAYAPTLFSMLYGSACHGEIRRRLPYATLLRRLPLR